MGYRVMKSLVSINQSIIQDFIHLKKLILIYEDFKKKSLQRKIYTLNDILIAFTLHVEYIQMCAINLNKP